MLRWLGLLLLAAGFFCLIHVPAPKHPTTRSHPRHPQAEARPMVVVLDPGHGGNDSGTISAGILEKDLTLDVALRADQLLRAAGLMTVMTRDDDSYVSLAQRASVGNETPNSLFISIHFNEGSKSVAAGVETYYSPVQSTRPFLLAWLPFLPATDTQALTARSGRLASHLQTALIEHTGAVDRGTKTQQFYVIENVRHPAALVEGGFMTNKEDLAKLQTSEYRQQLAVALCEGVRAYQAALEQSGSIALATPRPE